MALHVRGERGRGVIAPITDSALEWFPVIVGLEVNFEMVAAREGASTMLALVSFVAGVQLHVPVAATLVLEGPITIVAGVDGALVVVAMNVMVEMVMVRMVAGRRELRLVQQRGRRAR